MRLILVEDKDSFRRLLVQSLEGSGWELSAFPDPEAALAALAAEPFQVMVTDLRLPGFSGLELLRRAKRLQPALRVMLMSAYGEARDIVEAIHAGADDFLPKPFDLDLFQAQLERLRGLAAAPPPDPQEPWIAASPALRALDQALLRAAEGDEPVLLTGEPGSGRRRAARRLHTLRHPSAPFRVMPAAALPPLPGELRLAAGGSLLVTDLEELPPGDLPRLLEATEGLEGARIHWMGTARHPGELPEALRLRLGVLHLALPPLRARREDLLPLFRTALETQARLEARPAPRLERAAERALLARDWPGNARELAWCASLALRGSASPVISALPESSAACLCLPTPREAPLDAMLAELRAAAERQLLARALQAHHGRLPETAVALGLGPRTLALRLREHGISLEDEEGSPPLVP